MSPFSVLVIQMTFSLLAYTLLACWHVAPRLAALSRDAALVPLLWIHVFRYAPLALYATGQVDPRLPADVAAAIGIGDLVSAVAAVVALVALRRRAPVAMALVWLFTVVSISDLAFATYKAIAAQTYALYLGWNWYILNFYVPMLVVSQVMIVKRSIGDRERTGADHARSSKRTA